MNSSITIYKTKLDEHYKLNFYDNGNVSIKEMLLKGYNCKFVPKITFNYITNELV